MSYILDALRRAENERERERHVVPDLHTAQMPLPLAAGTGAGSGQSGRARGSALLGLALLALAAVAAWGVWRWSASPGASGNTSGAARMAVAPNDHPVGTAPSGGAPSAARPPAQAAVPPGMVAQIDGPPVPAQAAADANVRAMEAAALPPTQAEKPLAPAVPRAARDTTRDAARAATPESPGEPPRETLRDAAVGAAPQETGKVTSRPQVGAEPPPERAVRPGMPPALPPANPAATASVPAPVVPLQSLAPDLRSQIPPMTVGGAIYSDRPANRFVLINGQVVREGESPATGVTLERIGPKSAVMRWREMRFEMPL